MSNIITLQRSYLIIGIFLSFVGNIKAQDVSPTTENLPIPTIVLNESVDNPLIVGKWRLISNNGQVATHVSYNNDGTFRYTSVNEPNYEERGIYRVENNKLYELFNDEDTWIMYDIITLNSIILTLRDLDDDGVTYVGNPYSYQRENVTGINTPAIDNVEVYASHGEITIKEAPLNVPIHIYSTSGQMVYNTKATDATTTIALPETGIYLIKIKNKTYKISL